MDLGRRHDIRPHLSGQKAAVPPIKTPPPTTPNTLSLPDASKALSETSKAIVSKHFFDAFRARAFVSNLDMLFRNVIEPAYSGVDNPLWSETQRKFLPLFRAIRDDLAATIPQTAKILNACRRALREHDDFSLSYLGKNEIPALFRRWLKINQRIHEANLKVFEAIKPLPPPVDEHLDGVFAGFSPTDAPPSFAEGMLQIKSQLVTNTNRSQSSLNFYTSLPDSNKARSDAIDLRSSILSLLTASLPVETCDEMVPIRTSQECLLFCVHAVHAAIGEIQSAVQSSRRQRIFSSPEFFKLPQDSLEASSLWNTFLHTYIHETPEQAFIENNGTLTFKFDLTLNHEADYSAASILAQREIPLLREVIAPYGIFLDHQNDLIRDGTFSISLRFPLSSSPVDELPNHRPPQSFETTSSPEKIDLSRFGLISIPRTVPRSSLDYTLEAPPSIFSSQEGRQEYIHIVRALNRLKAAFPKMSLMTIKERNPTAASEGDFNLVNFRVTLIGFRNAGAAQYVDYAKLTPALIRPFPGEGGSLDPISLLPSPDRLAITYEPDRFYISIRADLLAESPLVLGLLEDLLKVADPFNINLADLPKGTGDAGEIDLAVITLRRAITAANTYSHYLNSQGRRGKARPALTLGTLTDRESLDPPLYLAKFFCPKGYFIGRMVSGETADLFLNEDIEPRVNHEAFKRTVMAAYAVPRERRDQFRLIDEHLKKRGLITSEGVVDAIRNADIDPGLPTNEYQLALLRAVEEYFMDPSVTCACTPVNVPESDMEVYLKNTPLSEQTISIYEVDLRPIETKKARRQTG